MVLAEAAGLVVLVEATGLVVLAEAADPLPCLSFSQNPSLSSPQLILPHQILRNVSSH